MKDAKITDNTIRVVQNTIPVLAEFGDQIANRMYEIIFSENPALSAVFNMSHQGGTVNPKGSGEQVRLLSSALLKYAEYIHDPFALSDMVHSIVSKHTSLNVQPAHYEVVERCLFRAFKDVLGNNLDHETETEWRTAYWSLSNLLIAMEENAYRHNENVGWIGSLPMKVIERTLESKDTVRLVLARQDNKALPKISAGQFVSVYSEQLNITRQYSLIRTTTDYFEIGVRLSTNGAYKGEMSSHMLNNVQTGDVFQVSMPSGGYNLDNLKGDVCLLSAGSGLTPNLSVLDTLSSNGFGGQVVHFYSIKNSANHAFQPLLKKLSNQPNFYSITAYTAPMPDDIYGTDYEIDGRINTDLVNGILRDPVDTNFFICGPADFIHDMINMALKLGVPRTRIQWEHFGASPVDILNTMGSSKETASGCVFANALKSNNLSIA